MKTGLYIHIKKEKKKRSRSGFRPLAIG